MPSFTESGVSLPIPGFIAIRLSYVDNNGALKVHRLPGLWASLPLVTYSRTLRRQIAHEGKPEGLLDAGALKFGPIDLRNVYRDVLVWLCTIYRFDTPNARFTIPAIREEWGRTLQTEQLKCLAYHRALEAFDLVPRVEQRWLRQAMWRASDSRRMPHPNWVFDVWMQLNDHDLEYVAETIKAAARSWRPFNMSATLAQQIYDLAQDVPDLWELVEEEMEIARWPGYGTWFLEVVRYELGLPEPESTVEGESTSTAGEETEAVDDTRGQDGVHDSVGNEVGHTTNGLNPNAAEFVPSTAKRALDDRTDGDGVTSGGR